jgi:GPH family glycoside/pentoside/hexuronide:cation symporter
VTSGSSTDRVGVATKLGYGIGCIAYSLPYQILASVFLLFATAILRVPALWAGAIIAVTAVWDAISDPLMGAISDNTVSRLGRRHPYIIAGGILVALLTWGLWSIDPAASQTVKILILLFLVLALKTALTIFVAPYNALGGELSTDYDERSSVQSYRALFYLVGMILALVGSNMYFFRSTPDYPRGQLNPAAYPALGATFAVVALVATAVTVVATRRFIPLLPGKSDVRGSRMAGLGSLRKNLRSALANRDFVALATTIFVIEVGFQIGIAIGFHVNTYTYRLPGPVIGILGLTVLGTSILSQPFWVWFSRRHNKKTSLWLGLALGFTGFLGGPFTHVFWPIFPLDIASLPFTLGGFLILAGLGNGAFMSIPYAMVADAADAEELRTGTRDEGLYFGLYTFAYKFGTSISLVGSGIALHLIGFDASAPAQSDGTRYWLAMTPAWLLILTVLPVIFTLRRYTIDRERQHEIRRLIEERRPTPPAE